MQLVPTGHMPQAAANPVEMMLAVASAEAGEHDQRNGKQSRGVRAWLFLRDALMGHKLFPYKYSSQQNQIMGALRALAMLPGQQADAQALLKARKVNRIPKPPRPAPEKRERSKRSKRSKPKASKRRKLPLPVPKPATPLHAGLSTSVRKSKGDAKKGGAKKGGAKKGGKKKGGKKKGGKKKGGKKRKKK